MSVSINNLPFTGGGNRTGGDDDNDNDDGVVVGCKDVDGFKGDHDKEIEKNKGKRVSCFRFRKVKSKFLRKKPKGVSVNSERRRVNHGGGGRCYLCLKEPLTSDSGGESQTSDPNSPTFTYVMLKSFIEKNDFYSKECNPHVDVEPKPRYNQDDK